MYKKCCYKGGGGGAPFSPENGWGGGGGGRWHHCPLPLHPGDARDGFTAFWKYNTTVETQNIHIVNFSRPKIDYLIACSGRIDPINMQLLL